jgi:hypothetical protein
MLIDIYCLILEGGQCIKEERIEKRRKERERMSPTGNSPKTSYSFTTLSILELLSCL